MSPLMLLPPLLLLMLLTIQSQIAVGSFPVSTGCEQVDQVQTNRKCSRWLHGRCQEPCRSHQSLGKVSSPRQRSDHREPNVAANACKVASNTSPPLRSESSNICVAIA
nr:hypothetical protein CFP56_09235 [Quercus suber]